MLHHTDTVTRVTYHVICTIRSPFLHEGRQLVYFYAQLSTLSAFSSLYLKMLSLTFATPLSLSLSPSRRPSSSCLARRRPQTAVLSSPVKIYSDAVAAYALQEKPAWCQPATILATGASICAVSDALFVPRGALGAIAVVANGAVFLWCKLSAVDGRDWGEDGNADAFSCLRVCVSGPVSEICARRGKTEDWEIGCVCARGARSGALAATCMHVCLQTDVRRSLSISCVLAEGGFYYVAFRTSSKPRYLGRLHRQPSVDCYLNLLIEHLLLEVVGAALQHECCHDSKWRLLIDEFTFA